MYDRYHQVGRELNDANLSDQTILRLKITSQSMSPCLVPGDYILVKSTPFDNIHRGDLLVTRRDNGYLTHRLISIDARGWVTKGDQNSQADAAVSAQAIVGQVVAYERGGKSFSLLTRSSRAFARIHGWLGWREIQCRSQISLYSVRLISHILQYISR